MLIDIHNHIIFGVDDGPEEIDESIELLKDAAGQGIGVIIATPHMRYNMFDYPKDIVENHYELLKTEADKIGIKLYLGCEYHVCSDIFEDLRTGRVHCLADTRYVLSEYSYASSFEEMLKYTQELVSHGYHPIIAHIERVGAIQKHPDLVADLQKAGALIQVNADSILGFEGHLLRKTTKNLLKNDYVDIIASDSHGISERENHLSLCYDYISRKYSDLTAEKLFYDNPGVIFEED